MVTNLSPKTELEKQLAREMEEGQSGEKIQ